MPHRTNKQTIIYTYTNWVINELSSFLLLSNYSVAWSFSHQTSHYHINSQWITKLGMYINKQMILQVDKKDVDNLNDWW